MKYKSPIKRLDRTPTFVQNNRTNVIIVTNFKHEKL